MNSFNKINLNIANNVCVSVPDSLQLMTTYVLHEQNDWFEDEIKFVRQYIKPGMRVIDIGANYGLYTLTIAHLIGESGHIWSFEPTISTASYLEESIVNNKFSNVTLIKKALSNKLGKARLYTSCNSELNSLSKDSAYTGEFEEISLITLDHCYRNYHWNNIDFIKLDAEGEENNIIKKGIVSLSNLTPLIMFELKHGQSINSSLINRFRKLNYKIYRLIPGLNILVPFDEAKPIDDYLLNLFCCKDDKARSLEDEGLLVRGWESNKSADYSYAVNYFRGTSFGEDLDSTDNNSSNSSDYLKIVNFYLMAHSGSYGSYDKVSFLMCAINNIHRLIDQGEQQVGHLVTFARIAFDAGERALGVSILSNLIEKYVDNLNFEISDVCFPASKRYDSINHEDKLNEWLFSSVLEMYIQKHAHSTYFTKEKSLPLVKKLNQLGFSNDKIKKCQQLIENGLSIVPEK